ncbi:MAG: bifunctional folylpolyglutamate synthase/dihydrofolate synthase [Alphaproteobacteria bacterium]|nr:bifunctional folylpolyglutamate synthase/dihydrofolate synthase [Alphaproteobacteria bacterium]
MQTKYYLSIIVELIMVLMPHWPKDFLSRLDIQDLSRMLTLMEKLGNPHKKLPPTIHVAGTNGKGSTCAMLRSIFESAGKYVHMYTSPHLVYFNERIIISGQEITDNSLFNYMERVRKVYEELNLVPSFFEAITIAAFLAYSENPADVLILETGIGGRLDCTNIIENPIATIVTPISFDHMEYLGNTISMIATEKAGIIKKGSKSIISMQPLDAMDVLLEASEKNDSESIAFEYDYLSEKTPDGFKFLSQMGDLEINKMKLKGDHQIINASAVIACIFSLKNIFNISSDQIKQGLADANWRGRIQKTSLAKFKNGSGIYCWLDAAHNIGGALALSNWIQDQGFQKPLVIFGMTKNRDIAAFLSQFNDIGVRFFGVPIMSEALSYSSSTISDLASKSGFEVEAKDSLILAIEEGIQEGYGDQMIICGSIYLLSDFLKI